MKSSYIRHLKSSFLRRWSSLRRFSHAILLVFSLPLFIGCDARIDQPPKANESPASTADFQLVDVTKQSGMRFDRDGGAATSFEMPQIMGSGGGVFDYDGDGDLDVYLIGGGEFPIKRDSNAINGRLFRQEKNGSFTDVTEEAGLTNSGYGMGIAVGDVDNDGDLDVFLSNVGDDRFYVNQGNGTFVNATEAAGVSDPKWSTACCFFDFDRDGWLDLIVVNYVDYYQSSPCYDQSGRRDFCGPQAFQGTVDRLYRNRGASYDGTGTRFEDVTVLSGLSAESGKGLGVLCADFNDDGRPDIFVANDMEPNRLLIQQQDGSFRDEATVRGVAVNQMGQSEANMGVAFEDFDGDGRLDLFVTHLNGETNTLWKGMKDGLYVDVTPQSGLGPPSLPMTGFGVAAVDLNLDGKLDLLVTNGHVKRPKFAAKRRSNALSFWDEYAQFNQIFVQDRGGHFELEPNSGESFAKSPVVGRALIYGDLDADGDPDFVITSANGPVSIYRNDAPAKGRWLSLSAFDPVRHRVAYGAKITVEGSGQSWVRLVQPSSGYLSHNESNVYFGLGDVPQIDRVIIQWPDQTGIVTEEFTNVPINAKSELRRGEGRPVDLPNRITD